MQSLSNVDRPSGKLFSRNRSSEPVTRPKMPRAQEFKDFVERILPGDVAHVGFLANKSEADGYLRKLDSKSRSIVVQTPGAELAHLRRFDLARKFSIKCRMLNSRRAL